MEPTSKPFPSPLELSDDQLLERLLDLQRRTRGMLVKYQIRPASFIEMARMARRSISNTEELSELYELFINLQEFGSIAKQRKVLDEASITQQGEQSKSAQAATSRRRTGEANPEIPEAAMARMPPLEDSGHPTGEHLDDEVSRDFFRQLDR